MEPPTLGGLDTRHVEEEQGLSRGEAGSTGGQGSPSEGSGGQRRRRGSRCPRCCEVTPSAVLL